MVNLMLAVGGLWGTIINWFQGFVGNFGLTIIVFTIILKLVLSPLEIYQKVTSKKQMEQQAKLQPQLAKIQKQYANNKDMLNQKTMELYKKENVNVMGNCFGMLINLVITLVVFITLFSSLNAISQANIKTEYETLQAEYSTVFKENLVNNTESVGVTFESTDTIESYVIKLEEALKGAMSDEDWTISTEKVTFDNYLATAQKEARESTSKKYGEVKEGFLWIKNIYRPDTWSSVFPSADEYLSISNTNFKNITAENPYIDIFGAEYSTEATAKEAFKTSFNEVTTNIKTDYSGWNGWLILVILSAVITVLSQIITSLTTKTKKQYDKKGNEIQVQNPNNNKLMLILLPVLMVVFTIQYSAAFALYIVVNSLMSVVIGFVTSLVMNAIEKKKEAKLEKNFKGTKGV